MKTAALQSTKASKSSKIELWLGLLFIFTAALLVISAWCTYRDALKLSAAHDWMRAHLEAGLDADMIRCMLANTRVEQSRYCFNRDESDLSTAQAFMMNGVMLSSKILSPNDADHALYDRIVDEIRNGVCRRQQEATEALTQGVPPEQIQQHLKAELLKDNDEVINGLLIECRAKEGAKLHEAAGLFERQLQRMMSNGLLVLVLLGGAVMLVITQRYIKARRKAEETVFLSEQRIRAIADNMLDGLVAIDKDGTVISTNSTAAELLTVEGSPPIGKNISEFFRQQNNADQRIDLLSMMSLTSPRLTQCLAVPTGRSPFTAEVAVSQVKSSTKLTQNITALVTIRDITEAVAAQKWRHDFVSTISHDLHIPLRDMDQSFKSISQQANSVPPKVLEVLSIAERNTARLLGLINDLAELENLTMGTLTIHTKSTAVAPMIERSLESVRALLEQKKITIETQLQPDAAQVCADDERIVQVLVNLLSNAIKFSPQGSTITISAARCTQADETVRISIADQGRGIPADKLASVFERYSQAKGSDARKGTGLGLPICKMIIEQHGGKISLTSEENVGTTFWFDLPV